MLPKQQWRTCCWMFTTWLHCGSFCTGQLMVYILRNWVKVSTSRKIIHRMMGLPPCLTQLTQIISHKIKQLVCKISNYQCRKYSTTSVTQHVGGNILMMDRSQTLSYLALIRTTSGEDNLGLWNDKNYTSCRAWWWWQLFGCQNMQRLSLFYLSPIKMKLQI